MQTGARAVPFRSRRRRARDGRLSFQRCLRDDRHVGERAAPVHPHVDAVAPRAHAPAAAIPSQSLAAYTRTWSPSRSRARRVVVVGLARVDDVVPVGPRVRAVGVVVRHEPRAELQREARRPRLAVLERLDDEPRDVADEPARPVLPARVGRGVTTRWKVSRGASISASNATAASNLYRPGRLACGPAFPASASATTFWSTPCEANSSRARLCAARRSSAWAASSSTLMLSAASPLDVAGFGAHRQLGRLRAPPVPAGARDRVGRASIARTVGVAGRELLGQVSPEEKPP